MSTRDVNRRPPPPMAPRAPARRRPATTAASSVGGVGVGAWESARVLLALAALYAVMSLIAYRVIHMRHVAPLPADAPRDAFAEGRVLQHLRRLAVDIPGRQEGSPGLEAAAQYIKGELEGLAARAGLEYRDYYYKFQWPCGLRRCGLEGRVGWRRRLGRGRAGRRRWLGWWSRAELGGGTGGVRHCGVGFLFF